MKNAWKLGRQAKPAASAAFFITHLVGGFKKTPGSLWQHRLVQLESVFDVLVNWAMKNAILAAARSRSSAFERFSSPC